MNKTTFDQVQLNMMVRLHGDVIQISLCRDKPQDARTPKSIF